MGFCGLPGNRSVPVVPALLSFLRDPKESKQNIITQCDHIKPLRMRRRRRMMMLTAGPAGPVAPSSPSFPFAP